MILSPGIMIRLRTTTGILPTAIAPIASTRHTGMVFQVAITWVTITIHTIINTYITVTIQATITMGTVVPSVAAPV